MNKTILSLFVMLLVLVSERATACSCFQVNGKDGYLVGRNYDWDYADGYLIVNRAGRNKKDLKYSYELFNRGIKWKSKYASLTFNQYGHSIAFSGINEAGLVVSELWLDETVYPKWDLRKSINVDQLVQYLLDNFDSVDQIYPVIKDIRIRPTTGNYTKIHFMISDRTGKSAIIEYLEGKLHFTDSAQTRIRALTNSYYTYSVDYVEGRHNLGNSSLYRFNAIYKDILFIPEYNVNDCFALLNDVAQGSYTKYSVVFDQQNMKAYINDKKHPNMIQIDCDKLFADTRKEDLLLSFSQIPEIVKNEHFASYTYAANRDMIKASWESLGYKNISKFSLYFVARYPGLFHADKAREYSSREKHRSDFIKKLLQ